jgi:radical SAM superfamily enzyme YgiQ (UPF0313 family)
MRLLLIYPEIECSITNTSTYSVPLGLGSIATHCKQRFDDSLEIRILDSSFMNHEEQLEEVRRFKPDITGISPTIASMHNGYENGKLAKELGSLVFFGGVNATNLWKQMLDNQDFIDGIILYEGEVPIEQIISQHMAGKKKWKDIPNLAFKRDGFAVKPELIRVHDLDELPDVDYSLFNLDRFFEQTKRRGFGKAISYYGGKGCAKRGGINVEKVYLFEEYQEMVRKFEACTFCGRNEVGFRVFGEDREARIIKGLFDKYGVRGFFNVQDTVCLEDRKPIGVDAWFRLFIGFENITRRNIEVLKRRYGPNLIFQAGIESADTRMREAYGKFPINSEDVYRTLDLMEKENVNLHASFILGGRTETEESMEKTIEVAKRIGEREIVTWLLMSPQLILPGSADYWALMQMPGMNIKYSRQDLVDIVGINEDFLKYLAALKRNEVLEGIKDVFNHIRGKRKDIVLDIKGVVAEEEAYVKPERDYVK